MKKSMLHLTFALAVAGCASNLYGQFADATGGSISILCSDSLKTLMQAQGVRFEVFTPAPFDIRIPFLGINAGVFNLATGAGSLTAGGNGLIESPYGTVEIHDFSLETVGSVPVLTGSVYVDNHFVMRDVVFVVMDANPLLAPLSGAPVVRGSIPLALSPNMVALFSRMLHITVPPGTVAAKLGVNIGFHRLSQQ